MEEFLSYKGLKRIRTTGGHYIWSRKDLSRPVVFQSHIEPVPLFIVKNILALIGSSTEEFREYFDK